MVTLPAPFVATKYPGYFFNTEDEKLYSIKIDGVLKQLKYHYANRWNHIGTWPTKLKDGSSVYSKGGYVVSVKGCNRVLTIEYLKDIEPHDSTIPVKEKEIA